MSSTGGVRLRRFYGARARRLLPASAAVGVITMIAAVPLLPPLQVRSVIGDGIASALYVSNYWFVIQGADYFAGSLPPSPFQHHWSLGVDEQFYLVWPALILGTAWLLRRARRRSCADLTELIYTADRCPVIIRQYPGTPLRESPDNRIPPAARARLRSTGRPRTRSLVRMINVPFLRHLDRVAGERRTNSCRVQP